MLYWFFFVVISISLCYFSTNINVPEGQRRVMQFVLILFISWFSGFRDHLGADYEIYTDKFFGTSYLKFGIEPVFTLFVNIIYYSALTPVFFFLAAALITNYLFVKFFFRYKYTFILLIIYILTPLFYYDTFNLVRQMCAASIFAYSCKYIESKDFPRYLMFVLLAFTIHFSAVVLLPMYFIGRKDFSKIFLSIVLIASYVVGTLIKIDFDTILIKIVPHYAIYSTMSGHHVGTGLLNIIFNIIMLILISKKQLFTTSVKYLIPFNLFFIGIVLSNFMPSFYYISRLAMYFTVFGPVVISMLIFVFNKKLIQESLVVGFLLLFSYFLIKNIDNQSIIPKKVLPVTSLLNFKTDKVE